MKQIKSGGGHRVCKKCGDTVFGSRYHICRVGSMVEKENEMATLETTLFCKKCISATNHMYDSTKGEYQCLSCMTYRKLENKNEKKEESKCITVMNHEDFCDDLCDHYVPMKTIEDGVTKEIVDKWLESFKALSESPDMERVMKEAYQKEVYYQRFKNRKHRIVDNPDADIIPGQSNEDYQDSINAKEKYPEGTDEEWVENAKRSCEATIKGAEEAVKIMKEDKHFPYTDIIHPNSTEDHITVDGEDGIKYTFPNPEKMKVNWLPERAFTPDREEDVKIVYDENISAIAISICEQLKLTESETGMFVAGFEECNKYLKNIVDKNEWRDASKEQPEDGVVVLNENCTKVFYQREKLYKYATPNCWFMNYEDGIVAIEVKYWMPLPEKPKFV